MMQVAVVPRISSYLGRGVGHLVVADDPLHHEPDLQEPFIALIEGCQVSFHGSLNLFCQPRHNLQHLAVGLGCLALELNHAHALPGCLDLKRLPADFPLQCGLNETNRQAQETDTREQI
eukprot:scaffold258431_cov49-Prasinocladus_malaysianus.AAC.1